MYDVGARIAPQFHSYSIDAPSNLKVSEFALPIFVSCRSPRRSRSTSERRTHGRASSKRCWARRRRARSPGLTDTQIRGNYVIGNDFIVLTAGVNLPTGQSTIPESKLIAASLIGSDFLSFPISNMGTGFGGTGGIALARPLGEWNLGVGISVRRSAQYDPVDVGGGPALHYQPGNEYRARVGLDRAVGTGRAVFGVTYSAFGDDQLAGSVYNTGNRYLTQFGFNNTVGAGEFSLSAWDLFRTSGTLADGSALDHENIGNAALSYSCAPRIGDDRAERRGPHVEPDGLVDQSHGHSWGSIADYRRWDGRDSWRWFLGRPSRGAGQQREHDGTLTGFHATLAVRLR